MELLDVNNLSIKYKTPNGDLQAASDINMKIHEGDTLGIVGESGCGKSTVAKSLLRVLDGNGEITAGNIKFKGKSILSMTTKELNKEIRWKEISYIPQDAMNALDPVYTIGSQMIEVTRTHTDDTKTEAYDRSKQRLKDVGLDEGKMDNYPHELSGGQQQRVVIAIALLLEPSLVIADEITTGLDVIIQDEILELISNIQLNINSSMVFISHDISAIAEVANRIIVMYGGEVVEIGSIQEVFNDSLHPYTIGLRNAFPSLNVSKQSEPLISMPGNPPNLINPPTGCKFSDRCPFSTSKCIQDPPFVKENEGNHEARCHYTNKSEEFRKKGSKAKTWV